MALFETLLPTSRPPAHRRLPARAAACLLLPLAVLVGCTRPDAPPAIEPGADASVTSAVFAGVRPGPSVASLDIARDDAGPALASFLESCPKLLRREDVSGLTRRADWEPLCRDAIGWRYEDAARFFEERFETVRVGDGMAFATGYFEPEIAGSRTRRPGFEVPVYALPPDLERAWPADMPEAERTGRPPLGRYDENGDFVRYYERAEIEDGALGGRGLEIAWAADAIEFFFLQIQGSGRLRTPEGEVIRIGYSGQNGRGYTGIGRVMRDRGLLGEGPGQYPGSMQGIMQYLRDYPEAGRELMRENKSWVFFRLLEGDGPLGALEVPVRALSSVAADPAFVPLGAPVFLRLDRPEANGLWIAQDTGGAIKGANRFDTFWGAGSQARETAGGMSARGQALILVPRGTVKRLRES